MTNPRLKVIIYKTCCFILIFSLLSSHLIFLLLLLSLLRWWVSSWGKTRNPEKVEYFSVPSVFLLQFDIYWSPGSFGLGVCFASCLLYCIWFLSETKAPFLKNQVHLESKDRDSSEKRKKKRKPRQLTLQRTESDPPKQPTKNQRDQMKSLTAVYHLKSFVGRG